MISVPMIPAITMFPLGKKAGACVSMKSAPRPTFMPTALNRNASVGEMSRTRPVALRRNRPEPAPPAASIVSIASAISTSQGGTRTMTRRRSLPPRDTGLLGTNLMRL